jgi:hypothetical protein
MPTSGVSVWEMGPRQLIHSLAWLVGCAPILETRNPPEARGFHNSAREMSSNLAILISSRTAGFASVFLPQLVAFLCQLPLPAGCANNLRSLSYAATR